LVVQEAATDAEIEAGVAELKGWGCWTGRAERSFVARLDEFLPMPRCRAFGLVLAALLLLLVR
jgi:hypothetical protein